MSDNQQNKLVPATISEAKIAGEIAGRGGRLLPSHIKDVGEATALILAGAELGMPPMVALRSFHLVEGRVCMAADAQLATILRAGCRAAWRHSTADLAEVEIQRPGHEPYVARYTKDMAVRAGLWGRKTWQAHPEAMLRARAITSGIRAYCPDLLSGIYSPDEAADAIAVEVVRPVAAQPTAATPPLARSEGGSHSEAPAAPATPSEGTQAPETRTPVRKAIARIKALERAVEAFELDLSGPHSEDALDDARDKIDEAIFKPMFSAAGSPDLSLETADSQELAAIRAYGAALASAANERGCKV